MSIISFSMSVMHGSADQASKIVQYFKDFSVDYEKNKNLIDPYKRTGDHEEPKNVILVLSGMNAFRSILETINLRLTVQPSILFFMQTLPKNEKIPFRVMDAYVTYFLQNASYVLRRFYYYLTHLPADIDEKNMVLLCNSINRSMQIFQVIRTTFEAVPTASIAQPNYVLTGSVADNIKTLQQLITKKPAVISPPSQIPQPPSHQAVTQAGRIQKYKDEAYGLLKSQKYMRMITDTDPSTPAVAQVMIDDVITEQIRQKKSINVAEIVHDVIDEINNFSQTSGKSVGYGETIAIDKRIVNSLGQYIKKLPIIHLRVTSQTGVTCGSHTIANARAIEELVQERVPVTAQAVRDRATSEECMSPEQLTEEMAFRYASALELENFILAGYLLDFGLATSYSEKELVDYRPWRAREEELPVIINAAYIKETILRACAGKQTWSLSVAFNVSRNHWVAFVLAKQVSEKPVLFYTDSLNSRLYYGSPVYNALAILYPFFVEALNDPQLCTV